MKSPPDGRPRFLPNWPVTDRQSRSEAVRRFFEKRAARYDDIANRPYWRFCGDLLELLLQQSLRRQFAKRTPIRVLDAGGGTGDWALRILASYPASNAVLLDFSESMLQSAISKAKTAGIADRLSIHRADLHDPIDSRLGLFDLVLCFHNVASLVADPKALIQRLRHRVAPGGVLALVVPNRYQASWECVRDGRFSELKRIREQSVVRYRTGFPDVFLFTPDLIRQILVAAACERVAVHGYPVSLSPVRSDAGLPRHLSPPLVRRRLLASELQLCMEEESAARGQHLLAIARVPLGRSPQTGRVRASKR